MTTSKPPIPKPNALRWEITTALLIKILLLVGLWFLIFHWLQKPTDKPDIAEHFALPATPSTHLSNFSSQP